MIKHIKILFFAILLLFSCKKSKINKYSSGQKQQEKVSKASENLVQNECLKSLKNQLTLPISGGDNLMTKLIESDIEPIEYNCDFRKDLEKKLCDIDSKSLFLLPKKNNVTLAILADECGDNNHYLLLSFTDKKIVDYKQIYQFYEEMETNTPKRVVKDFKIDEDFKVILYNRIFEGEKLKSETSKKYKIDSLGNILEIVNDTN